MFNFEPKQFGKYYLVEKIAVGGMAEIYKAKTFGVDGFEKLLAIKRILPHCAADKDFIGMLIDEAKLSVLLSHANIVQVFDLGKIDDDYFIAMEFINGLNLRDIMYRCREKETTIPTDIAVYITSEVCKGLDYAHRKTDPSGQPLNIVHRDISPQNILISYEGEVKIVDFGIAKAAMNISHTMAGILKGKIAYMSPEQAMGKTINHCTDIFSVGIILYEMLTNSKLFTGESQFEVLKKIRSTKIDSGKLPDEISEHLKPLVSKSLAYKIEERYQNAGDMQLDLTKYLYSTHVDFSPRKLSQFIKEMFADELKTDQLKKAEVISHEHLTKSMSVQEEARQIDIVHRSSPGMRVFEAEGLIKDRYKEDTDTSKTKEEEKETILPPQLGKKTPTSNIGTFFMIFLILLGSIGLVMYSFKDSVGKYIPEKLKFWEINNYIKPSDTKTIYGTVRIFSTPDQAKIFLDGKDTGKTTPAEFNNLQLNTAYFFRLEKEFYKPLKQPVILKTENPEEINLTLVSEDKGILNLISEPNGAAILLNGKATGQVTPATIENLELNHDYSITLSKPEYKDFKQDITLTSPKPQKISAVLQIVTGQINVTSNPDGAKILINNTDTGKRTPALIEDLKIKERFTVKLIKDGYDLWSKPIKLENTNPIDVAGTLQKKPEEIVRPTEKAIEKPIEKPATITPTQTETKTQKPEEKTKPAIIKEEPKEKPVKEPQEEPAATGGTGKLSVSSSPSDAQVFINSEYKGNTPLTTSVPSGKVKVIVSKDGFARTTRTINVKAGEKVSLGNIDLSDVFGEVSLSSTPPRAKVIFDMQAIPAKTPVTVRKVRRDQPHTVTLELDGYKTWSKSFEMGDGNKSFNVILEPQ